MIVLHYDFRVVLPWTGWPASQRMAELALCARAIGL
jgi:hypothetical protein